MSFHTQNRKMNHGRFQKKDRQARNDKPAQTRDAPSPVTWPTTRPQPPSRRWLYVAVALAVLAGIGSWALCENVIFSRVPPELVGKWVVSGGEQDGATFDFYRNGTMVGKMNAGGGTAVIKASVRVDGKTIFSTTQNPHTGNYERTQLLIKTLTATDLIVEDQRGVTMTMKRAE